MENKMQAQKRVPADNQIDLLKLAKALWHRAWIIVLTTIVGAAVALSYTMLLIVPQYEATTMLYINSSTVSVGATAISLSDIDASAKLVSRYSALLKSRKVLEQVIKDENLSYAYKDLQKMVTLTAVDSTEVINISVKTPNPEEAARIANCIADLMPDVASDIIAGSSVKIVDKAVVPDKPCAPSKKRNTAKGGLLGLVLSGGILTLLFLLDDTIHDEEEYLDEFELPLLATIPDLKKTKSIKSSSYNK